MSNGRSPLHTRILQQRPVIAEFEHCLAAVLGAFQHVIGACENEFYSDGIGP